MKKIKFQKIEDNRINNLNGKADQQDLQPFLTDPGQAQDAQPA
jgi:hypothetical protein